MSIEVRNISKSFGTFKALDDVSLRFADGELVALLGPSGCGKTTLLRVIAGLEFADSGRVLLDGQDATLTDVRQRHVGFVFQHYALFRHMTVFDNIAFGLRVRRTPHRLPETEIAKRVNRLLELVQLGWVAKRFPSQLSGGQRQRIALVRALAVEPRLLLLDEPFGALDAKVRKELRRWLRQLHDELHVSSIFVTHDQEEALELSDRIVLINSGRVEQVGAPLDVYERPATAFAYGFVGSANEFRGEVAGRFLKIGNELIEHGTPGLSEGKRVIAFARPHEMEVLSITDPAHGIAAKVHRVLRGATTSRVEFVVDEATNQNAGKFLEVELPRSNVLGLVAGQPVKLRARALSVFDQTTNSG